MIIPFIVLFLISISFILLNKNYTIIKDTGLIKILIFSIGILLTIISNIFITYNNYLECTLNYIFKHIGISSVLTIFYIYITLGYELGINSNKEKKFKFDLKETLSNNSIENIVDINENLNINPNDTLYKYLKTNKISILNSKSNSDEKLLTSKYYDEINENTSKKIKNAHTLFIRILILYPLYLLLLFILIPFSYYYFKEDTILKNYDDYYSYKCQLEKPDFILNFIYLLFLFHNFIKGRNVLKYECIYTYIRYIVISIIIDIAFGPLVNVNI